MGAADDGQRGIEGKKRSCASTIASSATPALHSLTHSRSRSQPLAPHPTSRPSRAASVPQWRSRETTGDDGRVRVQLRVQQRGVRRALRLDSAAATGAVPYSAVQVAGRRIA